MNLLITDPTRVQRPGPPLPLVVVDPQPERCSGCGFLFFDLGADGHCIVCRRSGR